MTYQKVILKLKFHHNSLNQSMFNELFQIKVQNRTKHHPAIYWADHPIKYMFIQCFNIVYYLMEGSALFLAMFNLVKFVHETKCRNYIYTVRMNGFSSS